MEYFKIFKYSDSLYQFNDSLGVLVTLVIGEEKALLFDTGYGIGDLKSQIRDITDKELIVVNSHGHMDHTSGNYQFEKIYINELDYELVKKHNSSEWRKNNIKSAKNSNVLPNNFNEEEYLSKSEGNIAFLKDNQIFDLGKITCKVIPFPGHTIGSIALLIPEMKILLVSDATCPFVWLFLEESTTVSKYIESVSNALKLDFEYFLVGHGSKLLPKTRMIDFLKVAQNIDLSISKKVTFQNFDNLNSYCYTLDKMYDQNGAGIIFDPNKLN